MMNNIFQDNSLFSQSKLLTVMELSLYQISEFIQVTRLLLLVSTIILEDLKINGFPEFNTELMLMSIISKFKSNSFHSYAMLILKLIIMEAPKRLLSYKLMKKYSTHTIIGITSTHGVKLKNSTHTRLSEKLINMFYHNSLT